MRGSIGIIARDAEGCAIGAIQTVLKGVMDPLVIEGTAAIKAIKFAQHIRFTNVILEEDALNIVNQTKVTRFFCY